MVDVDASVLLAMQTQIKQLQDRVDAAEQFQNQHEGIGRGMSGVNYPHPFLKVVSAEFGVGPGGGAVERLDAHGRQVVKTSNPTPGTKGFIADFWVPQFYDEPGFAPSRGYVDGLVTSGVGTVMSMTSVYGSGADGTGGYVAGIFPTALADGSEYVLVRYYLLLDSVAADPAVFADGMVWYRGDSDQYVGRRNGSTLNFLMTGDVVSSVIGSGVLIKTLDPTTWSVGANNIVTVSGGAVRIEALAFRVTTTLTSGGAATLAVGDTSNANRYSPARAVATITVGKMLDTTSGWIVGALDPMTGTKLFMNSVGNPNLIATVATAVFTAGAIEIVVIYTPLTSGATLA